MDQPVLFNVEITGKKVSKRKAPSVPVIKVNHELAKKRYYLHRRLKGIFPIDGTKREIDVKHYRSLKEIPVGPRWYVKQLIKLGYNVQLTIE
jgi:hypothetical protein